MTAINESVPLANHAAGSATLHQFYLGCLAHASYLIESAGQAAIVDPQRDVEQYLDAAARLGLTIRYVIETHLHADFVSGHRELAARTGAEIVIGAEAHAEFAHRAVRDGDVLPLGAIELRAVATPGHTPEGISWLMVEGGQPTRVLTGDTLFIGDVGRPDLAGGRGYTPAAMAAMLYDSLHEKLLALPDDVEVWPAHGAGSACGRNISKETSSTIGVQRRMNYALRPMSREEFVVMMTADLAAPPRYFAYDAELNRRGARALSELDVPRLDAAATKRLIDDGAVLIDVRDAAIFGASHIAGALNIGLGGQFASWSGTLLSPHERLLVFAETQEQADEASMRLARVGLENVVGSLLSSDGLPLASLPQVSGGDFLATPTPLLDVRRPGEYEDGHAANARNIPLEQLADRIGELSAEEPLAVICAGGYRSSIAASILARAGFGQLRNVIGGTTAWVRAGLPTES